MVFGDAGGIEVVASPLHFGALGDAEAHFLEGGEAVAHGPGDRVKPPEGLGAARERDIQGCGGGERPERRRLEVVLAALEGAFELGFDGVRASAKGGTLTGRYVLDRSQEGGNAAILAAKVGDAPLFKRGFVGSRGERRQRLGAQALDLRI